MTGRSVILVGGPADGEVHELPDDRGVSAAMGMQHFFDGPGFETVTYRDSRHVVDGLAVFVIASNWEPAPYDPQRARHIYETVLFAPMMFAERQKVTGATPNGNPLVEAFRAAWEQHAPKPMAARLGIPARVECGGHHVVWPCAVARRIAKPFVTAGIVEFRR